MGSMANNFETKHPRARDGKFTGKTRKEAGLALGNSNARELKAIGYITKDYLADCFDDTVPTYSNRERLIKDEIIRPIEHSGSFSRDEYDIDAIASRVIYQDKDGDYSIPITPNEFWKVAEAYRKDRFVFDDREKAVSELKARIEKEAPDSSGDYDTEAIARELICTNSSGKWGIDASRGELLESMGENLA